MPTALKARLTWWNTATATPASTWGARRAANGHPAPYRVKYWQIGNEINPNNQKYLDQFPAFIELMKKADAGARLMTSFPGQKLLDRVGRDIAYVCPHHYTPDLGECERDFLHIAEMLDHTPGCAQIKLGVTEWNIDAGSWGLGRAKQATLEAALMNARYLHLLMRHSDRVEMACRSNLANSYCGAIIETAASGSGVLKRGSYYVMYLYSHHAKPVPLWLEQFSDRLDLLACGFRGPEIGGPLRRQCPARPGRVLRRLQRIWRGRPPGKGRGGVRPPHGRPAGCHEPLERPRARHPHPALARSRQARPARPFRHGH